MQLIDRSDCQSVRESDMKAIGIDPSTARRQFRQYCGMTFAAYQRSRRLGVALNDVRSGAPVATAQAGAGFESGSGFRQAFERMFGAPASAMRENGATTLTADWIETPLGRMVAIAHEDGSCSWTSSTARVYPVRLMAHGATRRAGHTWRASSPRSVESRAGRILPRDTPSFEVPLAPQGSVFERRAWNYLRQIPFGQTRSYGQQATSIGAGCGARAVGRANGMNYLSIVIPCHRVVASNGDLTGYGGGLARKRWLLDHERRLAEGK
jgi:AraC family transcriptional regulator of adaptative response/methylated-DNA-[protein]-cysteine methyltransferase